MEIPLLKRAWHHQVTDATIEQCIKVLDDHGVVFGVIAAASIYGTYNDYMREALRRHKRLRATCIIDPRTDIYQLEQMKADGFLGIRFVWSTLDETPDIHSDDYRHMLRRVADLDWHVHIVDRDERIGPHLEALEKYGVRKIVVDHIGMVRSPLGLDSQGFKAILAALDRGKTWVKLSGGFRYEPNSLAAPLAKELVRVNGGDRLLWGSDWPFAAYESKVRYADTIRFLEEWVPDDRIRRKIGGETALKFYFT